MLPVFPGRLLLGVDLLGSGLEREDFDFLALALFDRINASLNIAAHVDREFAGFSQCN